MLTYHCKTCNREWESPADLMGVPKCKQCRTYGIEGKLPSKVTMNTMAFPGKKVVVVQFDAEHGVAVSVENGETKVIVANNGNDTEYKFPH